MPARPNGANGGDDPLASKPKLVLCVCVIYNTNLGLPAARDVIPGDPLTGFSDVPAGGPLFGAHDRRRVGAGNVNVGYVCARAHVRACACVRVCGCV